MSGPNEIDELGEHEYPDPGDLHGDDDDDDRVACPQCGQMIYEDSPRCPYCGHWVVTGSEASRRSRGWFWPILIVLLAALLVFGWRFWRL
jgi:hypothetical protein